MSVYPFHPITNSTVSISATTSTARVALTFPTAPGRFVLRIHNAGPNTAFINRGDAAVDAAVTNMPIPAGAIEVITILNTDKNRVTHVAAITATGTAVVYFTPGEAGI